MWREIRNWEWYLVNERGDVLNTKTNKLIVGDKNNAGYLRVCLYNGSKKKRFFRHRLVAEYFIDNPDKLTEVNHKDGNKNNNHYTNLEWCTREQNEQHAWDQQLKHYNKGTIQNKPFIVDYFDGSSKVYKSQNLLAKDLSVSQATVGGWLLGRTRSYKKYNIKSIKFINV